VPYSSPGPCDCPTGRSGSGAGGDRKQYTWDLSALFESDEQWEEAFGLAEKEIEEYAAYEGKISASARFLLECLKLNDEIGIQMDELSSYASRKT